jgi:hypothetical protein
MVCRDFGNTAKSCAIGLVGVNGVGNTAKSRAIELAGVNDSAFCAASFGFSGVWVYDWNSS